MTIPDADAALGADVGGTFTDVIVADESGRLTLGKSLTTLSRSFDGFWGGLENHLLGCGCPP